LYLVCRYNVGAICVQVQHTFDGETPFVAKRICNLYDQVAADDDSLEVGVEILESVRQVLHCPREATSEEALAVALGGQAPRPPDQGSIVTYRYLNHRMLDLVQSQVELMRSRMVRRIEWRIDHASTLRRLFPEGECLCSTTFEAAGVEGLQLVFYPSGYSGVRDGCCSYFLHCPAGSVLRGWLSIGKLRREARIAYERPGFYGRTNFSRFDQSIDTATDSILLALEIDEAKQDVTEMLSHATPMANEGRNSTSPTQVDVGLVPVQQVPEKVESNLKFRRNPGRAALEDVRQLPSIWTSKPKANVADALESFHTFADMKAQQKGKVLTSRGEPRRPASGLTGRLEAAPPMKNEVVTQMLNSRYMMYAT